MMKKSERPCNRGSTDKLHKILRSKHRCRQTKEEVGEPSTTDHSVLLWVFGVSLSPVHWLGKRAIHDFIVKNNDDMSSNI